MEGYELVVSTDLVTPNLFFVIPLENSLHKICEEDRKIVSYRITLKQCRRVTYFEILSLPPPLQLP